MIFYNHIIVLKMFYIRHAEKAYNNGSNIEFSLDPHLTDDGREAAHAKFQYLVTQYGTPSKIISSPYLRTRETAQIAANTIFELTGTHIDIICDHHIGEYLGHHKKKNINECLRPETLIHNPVPPEEWKEYSYRIRTHLKYAQRDSYIWYITHGIVIKSIAFFHKNDIAYPSELEGIMIDHTGIHTI